MTGASPPAFTPVNMVEQQLVAAANGGLEQQEAFERFILDETLYLATPEVPEEETVTFSQGDSIRLLNVPLNDGRQAAAVFTSPQRVAEAFGEVGYIGIQGRILFEMIRATPALLNPGQSYGVVWEPDSIAAMLGLPVERVVKKDTQIMLGVPADRPTELIERLKTAFAAIPGVEAAWLALAAWPEAQTQTWYLDVRTSSEDHEPIRRALPGAIEDADM
ncbi:MAG: enhanced serine sensitivity protein SseB C-terminal domain-containing protein, partial [Brevundimonas sp.]|uniref:enhanced serine sensitivity protein SseB C-terminal domain-containing protein n=1 Tax=Brevundimonas sp. TaxID=1871086 RepID=UPI002ABCED5A